MISYTVGIISWTQKELDRKTRKTLNIFSRLHPRADINRMHAPQSKGGRSLGQVEYTIM